MKLMNEHPLVKSSWPVMKACLFTLCTNNDIGSTHQNLGMIETRFCWAEIGFVTKQSSSHWLIIV